MGELVVVARNVAGTISVAIQKLPAEALIVVLASFRTRVMMVVLRSCAAKINAARRKPLARSLHARRDSWGWLKMVGQPPCGATNCNREQCCEKEATCREFDWESGSVKKACRAASCSNKQCCEPEATCKDFDC